MKILVIAKDIPHHSGTPKLKKDMIIGVFKGGGEEIVYDDEGDCITITGYTDSIEGGVTEGSHDMVLMGLCSAEVLWIETGVAAPEDYVGQKYLWQNGTFVLDENWVE